VLVTRRGVWISTEFFEHPELVTTSNHNIFTDLHTQQIATAHTMSQPVAFAGRCLATNFTMRSLVTAAIHGGTADLPRI
jgi:hypothetical protein